MSDNYSYLSGKKISPLAIDKDQTTHFGSGCKFCARDAKLVDKLKQEHEAAVAV